MSLIRKINLVEVLKEQIEAEGLDLPADLTDEQLVAWSEAQIRQYYSAGGHSHVPTPAQQLGGPEQLQNGNSTNTGSAAAITCSSKCLAVPTSAAAITLTATSIPAAAGQLQLQQASPLSEQQLQQLRAKFPPRAPATFKTWFPGLDLSKTNAENPTAVVICFHSSGNAEDMYTSEGTGARRAPSPLLEVCRTHGWQMLAVQLPGRGLRSKEAPLATLQEVAAQLLPLVMPSLLAARARYALVGHSMGCWAAYELLLKLLEAGLPQPATACFSAMPWPHIPWEQRPWRQQRNLGETDFKEECRGWDINEVVFSPGMWEMYQPMLRADFRLFDEYVPSSSLATAQQLAKSAASAGVGAAAGMGQTGSAADRPFSFPIRLFWGAHDRRVKDDMVQKWGNYTSADFTTTCIDGNHLFPLQPAAKQQWLAEVAKALLAALL